MIISILTVLTSLDLCDGVASYAINYYRALDHNQYRMDFLVTQLNDSPYLEEVRENGDHVFSLMGVRPENVLKFLKSVDTFFCVHHNYDIVHCHTSNSGAAFLRYAKKYGIQKRVLHSHATKSSEKKWKEIRNALIIPLTMHYTTNYFACSKLAGNYLFGKKSYDLIHNAINVDKFAYCEKVRQILKSQLCPETKLVVGTVGRICNQKNPFFLVDILVQLKQIDPDFIFLWFGDGPLVLKVKDYALHQQISNKIIFMGTRADVSKYYSLLDVFILPSFYEGLPVVGVEAQAAGLPVLVSDTVTKELDVTGFCRFLPLNSADLWADRIREVAGSRNDNVTNAFRENGYGIRGEVKKLEKLYQRICE